MRNDKQAQRPSSAITTSNDAPDDIGEGLGRTKVVTMELAGQTQATMPSVPPLPEADDLTKTVNERPRLLPFRQPSFKRKGESLPSDHTFEMIGMTTGEIPGSLQIAREEIPIPEDFFDPKTTVAEVLADVIAVKRALATKGLDHDATQPQEQPTPSITQPREGQAPAFFDDILNNIHFSESLSQFVEEMSNIRRYSDGLCVTMEGKAFRPGKGEALLASSVDLPYPSTDVLQRLGHYDVLSPIESLGLGQSYRAYSTILCRMCVIKVFHIQDKAAQEVYFHLRNLGTLAARLHHPNILGVSDAGEEGEYAYLVREQIQGYNLKEFMREHTGDRLQQGLSVLCTVIHALSYAHKRGVVHTNLKPENILIDTHGRPYLTDFGSPHHQLSTNNADMLEALLNNPYYLSPEQVAKSPQGIGPHTDIYAFGAILYELLTEQTLFTSTTIHDVFLAILQKEPVAPSDVGKQRSQKALSSQLGIMALKALEKEVTERYRSLDAMEQDLKAHLEQRPLSIQSPTRFARWTKQLRRNRTFLASLLTALGCVLLLTLAFGAVILFAMTRTNRSLHDLDRQSALTQAAMLERSIRANMLEGRADIVRRLASAFRKSPTFASLEIVRPDRSLAYSDLSTRQAVGKRLSKPATLQWTRKHFPWMLKKLKELQRVGFHNIDQAPAQARKMYKLRVPRKIWDKVIVKARSRTVVQTHNGKKTLTVLWPILNQGACQVCHGQSERQDSYSGTVKNRIRAVLVVRRHQTHVERHIQQNRRTTVVIGATTIIGALLLLILFLKLLGVRSPKQLVRQHLKPPPL